MPKITLQHRHCLKLARIGMRATRGGYCLQTNPDFVFGHQMDAIESGEDKVGGVLIPLSLNKEIIEATRYGMGYQFNMMEKLSFTFYRDDL